MTKAPTSVVDISLRPFLQRLLDAIHNRLRAATLTGRFSHAFRSPLIACRSNRSQVPSFFTTM